MASRYYDNRDKHEWWSVHVEAWQRSGLSQVKYCTVDGLERGTFVRWLNVATDAKMAKLRRARGFGPQASPQQEGREADNRPPEPCRTGVLADACRSLELERNERQGIRKSAWNIAVQPAQMTRSDC
ncbi:MAG: hypothetical protein COA41_19980 [Sphingopyxis sp.]|nr:MAG: hypothetical protein COA41_19980 [Sphingopyxis sp.]